MRSLPFNTAASRCATSDLGMRPGSRYRSRPGRLLPAGPVGAGPECRWKLASMSQYDYQFV